jgi:hypothetical protein
MVPMLWVVMIALAVLGWFVQPPSGHLVPRIAFSVVQAAFLIWVIATQLDAVGLVWVIVAVLLTVALPFRPDIERLWKRG